MQNERPVYLVRQQDDDDELSSSSGDDDDDDELASLSGDGETMQGQAIPGMTEPTSIKPVSAQAVSYSYASVNHVPPTFSTLKNWPICSPEDVEPELTAQEVEDLAGQIQAAFEADDEAQSAPDAPSRWRIESTTEDQEGARKHGPICSAKDDEAELTAAEVENLAARIRAAFEEDDEAQLAPDTSSGSGVESTTEDQENIDPRPTSASKRGRKTTPKDCSVLTETRKSKSVAKVAAKERMAQKKIESKLGSQQAAGEAGSSGTSRKRKACSTNNVSERPRKETKRAREKRKDEEEEQRAEEQRKAEEMRTKEGALREWELMKARSNRWGTIAKSKAGTKERPIVIYDDDEIEIQKRNTIPLPPKDRIKPPKDRISRNQKIWFRGWEGAWAHREGDVHISRKHEWNCNSHKFFLSISVLRAGGRRCCWLDSSRKDAGYISNSWRHLVPPKECAESSTHCECHSLLAISL
jgi:hypothetical protein